jgi:hypothetical protein
LNITNEWLVLVCSAEVNNSPTGSGNNELSSSDKLRSVVATEWIGLESEPKSTPKQQKTRSGRPGRIPESRSFYTA